MTTIADSPSTHCIQPSRPLGWMPDANRTFRLCSGAGGSAGTSDIDVESGGVEGERLMRSVVLYSPEEGARTYRQVKLYQEQARTHFRWNWTIDPKQGILASSLRSIHPSAGTRAVRRTPRNIVDAVECLFRGAADVPFEDGMETPFSRELERLILGGGEEVRALLTQWILRGKASPNAAAEALRCLGRLHDEGSYEFRRWLLERCLESRSRAIRDAAALGLAAMEDPHAIPFLRAAIDREPCKELRADLEQVLLEIGG